MWHGSLVERGAALAAVNYEDQRETAIFFALLRRARGVVRTSCMSTDPVHVPATPCQ